MESLASPRLLSLADMVSLQQDYLSIPARWLIPLLSKTRDKEARALEATKLLEEWDHVLDPGSPAAAIYMNWERQLVSRAWDLRLPEELRDRFSRKSLKKTIEWLQTPGPEFGADPVEGRDRLLLESLQAALEDLEKRFGPDRNSWKWGGPDLHHTTIRHTLSGAVRESRREKLDIGPVPRGGSASTVNMTNNTDNQTSGASFRVVFDLEDWDRSLATNMPGQSGDPDSTHYRDLVDSWAADQYFPLLYSKEKIKAASELKTVLVPARKEEPGDR